MGAFIWEDNIAGKFSLWNKKRYVELEVIMMSHEENPIAKGVLFLSSMKSQENVEQMVMQIKVQCAKRNILVEDVAVAVIVPSVLEVVLSEARHVVESVLV